MAKGENKKRKQDLGIFYTPQEVVDFIFDILNIWKNREDKETHRWQTRKPNAHYPSVIDPACGEGVFLKTAVTSGFTGYHPTEKTHTFLVLIWMVMWLKDGKKYLSSTIYLRVIK